MKEKRKEKQSTTELLYIGGLFYPCNTYMGVKHIHGSVYNRSIRHL